MPRAKKKTTDTEAPAAPPPERERDPLEASAATDTATDANGSAAHGSAAHGGSWTVESAPGVEATLEVGPPATAIQLPAPPPPPKAITRHTKRRRELTTKVSDLLHRFEQHRFPTPNTADDALRELFAVYCATGKLDEDEAIADALAIQYRELNRAFQAACIQRETFEHLRAVPVRHQQPPSPQPLGNRQQRRAARGRPRASWAV